MSKSVDRLRREEILAQWPVHRQLEALTEAQAGDSTKLDELQDYILAIKGKHSKSKNAA